MKKLILLFLAFVAWVNVNAQTPPVDSNKVFTIVEQAPKFPGDIYKYLSDNIVYPVEAKNRDIQGTVYVSFVVERDGSVSNARVLRGVAGGNALEDEALRVVKQMPKWEPGMQGGMHVRVQYTLPVRFILQTDVIVGDSGKVFTIVQEGPKFPGDINKYLSDNIIYPPDAQRNNIEGTVYVKFVVEKEGSVSSIEIMRGIAGGRSLENEAVRAIALMPKWQPGKQNGHTVRVQYMVPVSFKLK